MNKRAQPLPDISTLVDLHKLWQDKGRPNWNDVDEYYEKKLRTTLKNHLVTTNRASIEILVDYTIKDMRYTLESDFMQENHMDLLNDFQQLLITNKMFDSVLSKQESANILATFTLVEVILATAEDISADKKKRAIANTKNRHITLEALAGRNLSASATGSLEAAVDAVYGPAVWTIYRDSVDDIYDMPKLLWSQNVPVRGVGLRDVPLQNHSGLNLPNDFT